MYKEKCTSNAQLGVHFFIYKSFDSRAIMLTLYSHNECAYLFSVIVAFLCPNISASDLTSMPLSNARVANVCRNE